MTNTNPVVGENQIAVIDGNLTQKERKSGKTSSSKKKATVRTSGRAKATKTATGSNGTTEKEKTTPEGVNVTPSSGRIAVKFMPKLADIAMPEAPSAEELQEARKRKDEFLAKIDEWMLKHVSAWNEYRENGELLDCGLEQAEKLANDCLAQISRMIASGSWRASAAFFCATVSLAKDSSPLESRSDLIWLVKGYKEDGRNYQGLLVNMGILSEVPQEAFQEKAKTQGSDQFSLRVLGRSYVMERQILESGIPKEKIDSAIKKLERMDELVRKDYREQQEGAEKELREWASKHALAEKDLESGKPGRIFLYVPSEEGNLKSRSGYLAIESRDGLLTVKGGSRGLQNFGSSASANGAFFPVDQLWRGKKENGKVDFGEFLEGDRYFNSLDIGKFVVRGIKYARRGEEMKAERTKKEEKKAEFKKLAAEKRTELKDKAREGSFLNFLLRKPGLYFCNPMFPDGYFFNKNTEKKVFQTFFLLEILEDGRMQIRDYFRHGDEGNGGRTEIFEPFAKEPWTVGFKGSINGEYPPLRILLFRWAGFCEKRLSEEEALIWEQHLAERAKTESIGDDSKSPSGNIEERIEAIKESFAPLSLEAQQELAAELAGEEDVSDVKMPDPSEGREN
ncbi:MAG: hypothetical protein Q8Q06_04545 [bacterium]|nr:hypothetical protein [bacterium]